MKGNLLRLPSWQRIGAIALLGVLLLLFILWLVLNRQSVWVILTPFILSIIMAYLLAPLVNFMEQRKISRSMSILVIYLAGLILIFIFSVQVVPLLLQDLQSLAKELPAYVQSLQKIIDHLQEDYRRFNIPANLRAIIDNNIAGLENLLSAQLERFYGFILHLFNQALLLLLVPVLTFYFLRDEEQIKSSLYRMVPRSARRSLLAAISEINKGLGAFLRGALLVSMAVGLLAYIAFLIIGIDFPLVLAFICGVTNLIPFIGPFIGAIPALLVALMHSPLLALKVAIIILVIQQIESQLIYPLIIGRSTGFHPLVIILAMLLAGQLFGLLGLIVALPLAIILRIAFKYFFRAWRNMQ